MQPGGSGCNHTDGAAQSQTRGRYFTPRGATVVIAVRAEKLFQIIIGPGQIRHRIAGEESWPVTTGDLTEVPQRWGKCAAGGLRCRVIAPRSPPRRRCTRQRLGLVLVAEDVGCLMDPAIPHPYVGHKSAVSIKPRANRPFSRRSSWGKPPFFRAAETRSNRGEAVVEFEPEASRGGRPSSVRALRTAAQSPRTTSASGSLRPARRRSMGRTPRTRFFSSFLAWRSAS